MRDIFLEYARQGAMTVYEVAVILRRKPSWVLNNSRGPNAKIPRLLGKPIRFDPMAMIDVFCKPAKAEPARSSTIERHRTGDKPNGGYHKCL